VETGNTNLDETLNNWLASINFELRGKIPVGFQSLAKEYFRERWKGSSFLLLRTLWEEQDGLILPTKLWFVNGEDIKVDNNKDTVRLGEEKYKLLVKKDNPISIPMSENEEIFIQKPFSSWGDDYPTPFLIQRGVYKNMKMLEILAKKGETIIRKALEYLMLMKKGTEKTALDGRPEFVYSKEDLEAIKSDFKTFLKEGGSNYFTNFDTDIEHLIPDYKKALDSSLYEPIIKRILSGLGLVEIVEGISSTRRESILNPKPFISEIKNGIEDLKTLIQDVLYTIVEKNKDSHPKYFSNRTIKVYSSPIKEFITKDVREHIRSAYDRGNLSKRSYTEVGCDLDFDIEVRRRHNEFKEGLETLLYPHVVQNKEGIVSPTEERRPEDLEKYLDKEEKEIVDRTGPEKKNFQSSKDKVYEEAPYQTNKDLPDNVRNSLPARAQTIYRKAFNDALERYGNEGTARKVAWNAVKKVYKKVDDKWKKKNKGELEESFKELDLDELISLKKLEILGKQQKLLDEAIEEGQNENS
ncbi:MAG: ChaB family protein, partial [Elusimicrobiota bacterium]